MSFIGLWERCRVVSCLGIIGVDLGNFESKNEFIMNKNLGIHIQFS